MERTLKDIFLPCLSKLQLSAGFTLIEVGLVVMVMGIIATISLPALNSTLQGNRLRGAADEVVTALEYAQLTAMTSGLKMRVSVSPTLDTIYVRRYETAADLFTGGDELAAGVVESETWEYVEYPLKKGVDYVIDLKGEDRFMGVDITASDFDTLDPAYFDASGIPSHGGTATLALGGSQIIITMDALTGKVSVSD